MIDQGDGERRSHARHSRLLNPPLTDSAPHPRWESPMRYFRARGSNRRPAKKLNQRASTRHSRGYESESGKNTNDFNLS